MRNNSVKTFAFYTIAILAVTFCVTALVLSRSTDAAETEPSTAASHPAAQPVNQLVQSAESGVPTACSSLATTPHFASQAKSVEAAARELADAQRYKDALARYREVALADPGFPGVNLDLSVTLLKLKQTEAAHKAIDTQLAVSQCLAHLPAETLDAYCKSEQFSSTFACMHELDSVQQGAYIQAALVQMNLGHPGTAAPATNTAALVPPPARISPSAAPAAATPIAHAANKPPAVRKSSGDNPLASGSGTDAALGAYSK